MGPPKQKWTQEEEAALKAGVDRYGPGKWSTILKDAEIAPLLAARSNVDLKDKWRNMNVGLGGHGSRQRSIKSVPKNAVVKGVKDSNSHMPAVALPNLSTEQLSTDTCSISGALVSSNGSEDMNLLEGDDRYNEWIVDAVKSTKDSNGCSPSTIAAIIEAHHPVPANFRKLLSMKLKDMVNQGSLIKIRQNFMVNSAEFAPSVIEQEGHGTQKAEMDSSRGGLAAVMEVDSLVGRPLQAMNVGQPAVRSINNPTRGIVRVDGQQDLDKGKLLVEYTKTKARTAEEAARVAALAVAEAEAAAAAAEKATREAELAEEEAENAEIAAQKAAKDALIQKKGRSPVS